MVSAIGAQMYTLRDFLKTPAEIASSFEKVRELGYRAMQLSGLGPADPADVGVMAADQGLTIAATHIGYDRICEDPQAVIDEHKLWGCRHVAIGGLPGEFRNHEGFSRFGEEASKAARPLIDAGLTFSYHNHSFELERFGADGTTGLDLLIDSSDPDVFSFEVDTYWIQHGGGNPVSWLRKLKDRMHIVHLKDLAMDGGEQLFAEVGEGNLEWPEILDACKEAEIEWYLVEQDRCQRDPFESLGISLRNLQGLGLR